MSWDVMSCDEKLWCDKWDVRSGGDISKWEVISEMWEVVSEMWWVRCGKWEVMSERKAAAAPAATTRAAAPSDCVSFLDIMKLHYKTLLNKQI